MAKSKKEYKPEELVFQCPECNKRFATKFALSGHMRMAHGATTDSLKDIMGNVQSSTPEVLVSNIQPNQLPVLDDVINPNQDILIPTPTAVSIKMQPDQLSQTGTGYLEMLKEIKEQINDLYSSKISVASQGVSQQPVADILNKGGEKSMDNGNVVQSNNVQEVEDILKKYGFQPIQPAIQPASHNQNMEVARKARDARERITGDRLDRDRRLEEESFDRARRLDRARIDGRIEPSIHPITKKIDDISEVLKNVTNTLGNVGNLQENQKILGENLVKLEGKLPDNFCSDFPDLCNRMTAMEKMMGSRMMPTNAMEANEKVSMMMGCPNCKKAILDQAKGHIEEIIGNDKKLVAGLAKKQGLKVSDPKNLLDF